MNIAVGADVSKLANFSSKFEEMMDVQKKLKDEQYSKAMKDSLMKSENISEAEADARVNNMLDSISSFSTMKRSE